MSDRSSTPREDAYRIIDFEIERHLFLLESAPVPKPGDLAPDFQLPDANGESVGLHKALENGPVILVFFRGGWCPFCDLYLRKLQASQEQLRKFSAEIIAVSPQLPSESAAMSNRSGLRFPLLSDKGNKAASEYGIVVGVSAEMSSLYASGGVSLEKFNGPSGSSHLPLPSTFIVGTDKILDLVSVNPDYTHRIEPAKLIQCMQDIVAVEHAESSKSTTQ